jgi:glycosyltransferase involved in cell wall biosynthesis
MKNILLRAPVLTQSGYGVHSRQLFSWLLNKENRGECKVSVHPLPWGQTPWLLHDTLCDGLIGKILPKVATDNVNADLVLSLQLPNEWANVPNVPHIGLSAMIETDICNPEWVQAVNKMTAVIVPSAHAKKSLENTGKLTTAIEVIPESYPEALLEPVETVSEFSFSTPFNFLIVGQITGENSETDRKNLFFTIKWISECFENNPNVGIIIKTNSGTNTQVDKERTKAIISRLMRECRKSSFPKVHLIHGELTDKQMAALYKHETVKAYVSLTRGEGFGLPTLEAAVAGVPVIATNWSGHLDFLNLGKFMSVNYTLEPVHQMKIDGKLFMPGARWAKADEQDFKKKIKKFYESPSVPKEWAKNLSQKLIETHSQAAIEVQYENVLRKFL